jgi:hypothetical protein
MGSGDKVIRALASAYITAIAVPLFPEVGVVVKQFCLDRL